MKHETHDFPQIPDKVYFRIGEVSQLVGVDTHVLRYWESEFPMIKPFRGPSKQRLYRRQDVENLLRIKCLLHDEGYTISGARRHLKHLIQEQGNVFEAKQNSLAGDPNSILLEVKQELHAILKHLGLAKEK